MALPNLMIVGSQKCGTTWLHECLRKSRHVFGSKPKELNFFNAKNHLQKLPEYEAAFDEAGDARWRMESTPHYLRLPDHGLDVARRIHDLLGDEVRLIVMLRDPVERYLSAYTHHIMQGRFDYTPEIDMMINEYRMLAHGDYASLLTHWHSVFPGIGVFLYDDLLADPVGLTDQVMGFLDTENDIAPEDTNFQTNAKLRKAQQIDDEDADWSRMPVLSPALREDLSVYYRAQILELEQMIDRDLSHWSPLKL